MNPISMIIPLPEHRDKIAFVICRCFQFGLFIKRFWILILLKIFKSISEISENNHWPLFIYWYSSIIAVNLIGWAVSWQDGTDEVIDFLNWVFDIPDNLKD